MLLSLNAIGGQSRGTDTASSFVFLHCNCVHSYILSTRGVSSYDYYILLANMSAFGSQFSCSLSTGAIRNDKKLADNLLGLILLVLLSSFTVTVCTVRDYHRVEFQALISLLIYAIKCLLIYLSS